VRFEVVLRDFRLGSVDQRPARIRVGIVTPSSFCFGGKALAFCLDQLSNKTGQSDQSWTAPRRLPVSRPQLSASPRRLPESS